MGMSFRANRDPDILLILEAVDADFVSAMQAFITEGRSEIQQRSEGGPRSLRQALIGSGSGLGTRLAKETGSATGLLQPRGPDGEGKDGIP
jgi:hypothetical protein